MQQQVKAEVLLNKPAYIKYLNECLQEAVTTFNHPDLQNIFNPADKTQTFNEMPLMYKQQQQVVYGVIDRVIKAEDSITIIDYKSQQNIENESTQHAASQFSAQMAYYRNGVEKLWPEHTVRTGILFTHHNEIVWLE